MSLLQALRRTVALGAFTSALGTSALGAQSPDQRPTLAVLPFEIAALVNAAEYAPLNKGISEMLTTALANNPKLRVVERDRLQSVLEELNLGNGERIDKEAAVRIGKMLGAHHMVTGSFIIDMKKEVVMTVRSIRTETTEIEYADRVRGKSDDLFGLIDQLGAKANAGLKLPPMPTRVPSVPGGSTEVLKGGPNQFRAMMLVSRALERQDRGDMQGAIALYRSALQEYPNFERARTLLASAEGAPGAKPGAPF